MPDTPQVNPTPKTAPVQKVPSAQPSRTILVVAALSVVAIVISGFSIFLSLTRPAGGGSGTADSTACRTMAWNALPNPVGLPAGWTLSTSNFYVDGAGASVNGPVPADGSSAGPTIYLQVTCFGGDGHLVMSRFHDSANAAGGSDVDFTKLGDESFASLDSTGQGTSVYIRRGQLVASLLAPADVASAELTATAAAVDTGLAFAASGGQVAAVPQGSPRPLPSTSVGSPATGSPGASAGDSAPAGSAPAGSAPADSADPSEQHAAPDLEALLPRKIGGVALTYQSTDGTTALAGDDASTKALVASLTQMGKTVADLDIAEAYDGDGSLDAQIIAFRVTGISADKLGQAILDSWLSDGASGITSAKTTISGKTVTKVTYSDGGPADYLYLKGEVVYDLSTSTDSVVTDTLSQFP